VGVWILKFGICLVFGAWDLVLGIWCFLMCTFAENQTANLTVLNPRFIWQQN
jgi:hypothetical protein